MQGYLKCAPKCRNNTINELSALSQSYKQLHTAGSFSAQLLPETGLATHKIIREISASYHPSLLMVYTSNYSSLTRVSRQILTMPLHQQIVSFQGPVTLSFNRECYPHFKGQ